MATTAEVKTYVQERIAFWLDRLGWTTDNLDAPIAWSVQALGYDTDAFNSATDGNLAELPESYTAALVDLTEYRSLQMILQNFSEVTVKVGDISQSIKELRDTLTYLVEQKLEEILAQHGTKLAIRIADGQRRYTSIRIL